MQKLVTIFLWTASDQDLNRLEHLGDYFKDGWRVVSITPMGSGGGDTSVTCGWLAVLMEK